MRFEIPEFKRCCFCVPLRYGLLVWSYLSLMLLGLLLAAQIMECMFIYYGLVIFVRSIFYILLTLGNILFTFLLIVAAHKKSSKMLKIYSICGITMAIINFFTLFCSVVYDMSTFGFIVYFNFFLDSPVMGLIFIGMQIYILALVRNEIMKLNSNIGFEFHNIGVEAERDYYEPVTVKVDEHKDGFETEIDVQKLANKKTEEKQ